MPVERRGWVTHGVCWVNGRPEEPSCLTGRRQPSLSGTSRMRRESPVRICERLGVKFPGPTRRMATANAGRAARVRPGASRPCGATASRSPGGAGARRTRSQSAAPALDSARSGHDPRRQRDRGAARQGALRRRARANPAAVEARPEGEHQTQPEVPAGKGEILIVSHGGKGWWDPTSEARGDVFGLVQKLEPGLNFGHVRKRLREFAGLPPSFPPVDRAGGRNNPDRPVAERWAERKAVWPNSPTWRYLARKRWLPSAIIEAASAA